MSKSIVATHPAVTDKTEQRPPISAGLQPWYWGSRAMWVAVVLLVLILISVGLTSQWGAIAVQPQDWWIWGSDTPIQGSAYVLWELRLPRIGLALLVGGALGLTGALTQALFRNPLADPALLGVSTGAGMAAALSIVVFASLGWGLPAEWRVYSLPVTAFIGALTVCLILDRVSRWLTHLSITGLLLTGIALNALAGAVIGLCVFLANDEQLRSLNFWMLGSLAGGSWWILAVLSVLLLLGLALGWRFSMRLNALALGEQTASQIGVSIHHLRVLVIVLVALLCGVAVAWCGAIGFVGLIAPHMVRMLVGGDQRVVLPLSILTGGLLLLWADTAARLVVLPSEMPVGIFTAVIGAPFFLFLLWQARQRLF